MREKLFPFYRQAANDLRHWQRELESSKLQRHTARNPLRWGEAVLDGLGARMEIFMARRWKNNLAQGLDHARVNAALGWPEGHQPVCESASERPSRWRTVTAAFSALALTVTPLRAEFLPLTADQKLEYAMLASICHTGASPSTPTPTPQAPCCAPKNGLEPRQRKAKNGAPEVLA
jgi:hypothetical protein